MSTATSTATVVVTSPAPRGVWRDLVATEPGALPEHDPIWTDALCATGRFTDQSRHYAFADGSSAVLPLVARRGVLGTIGWADSFPSACGIGGPVGLGVSEQAARIIIRDLRALGYQHIGIRPNPLDGATWAAAAAAENVLVVPRRAHVIDLRPGFDAVWMGLSKSGRRNVRLARRADVRTEVGFGGELLDEYYELYLSSVNRWAVNQHEPRLLAQWRAGRRDPLAKLHTIGEHLGANFSVILAYVDDVLVAGTIGLYGRTGHGTRAALDINRIGRSHASELIYWMEIELAIAAGCTTFHMGETGASATLARAKEKYGAKPYDYVELRIERLPWTRMDTALRTGVKRVIGFRDA